ncbi:M23 family metallopeptidase [Rhizobium oryzicola]|uniref:M23 family metallopeptidase n=1 Tax=Rhizobium oryzicola TaxID=1232668 RepID=A0ABT8T626_9HYPH|nr:M23 family metallopeptidase [Rhizobium oryzicola]MDO1585618.1 M23 family metallopeptidase [Rhizobium oryzicola]
MAKAGEHRVFGRAKPQHVLILASGEKIRHMTVRPWMIALGVTFLSLLSIGYLAATTYLVLRDDLIGAAMARQSRMQHEYEDRISSLRAQLDRITSRQLLDQQVVEQKVEQLLDQQNALFSRHGKLGSLLDRAQESGLTSKPELAAQPPQKAASSNAGVRAIDHLLAPDTKSADQPTRALGYAPLKESLADKTDRIFSKVTRSLKSIEQEQLGRIRSLTDNAEQTADEMTAIMRRTGVEVADAAPPLKGGDSASGIGGPFVEPIGSDRFDASLNQLDSALNRLEAVRQTAVTLPYGNPAPGHEISSRFGNRIDPFLGKLALHAGIDFQAETGTEVRSTGSGTVVSAGYTNGYGNMVEIDHGHGITTRYGHMSSIAVSEGDKVSAGEVLGKSGSTGRSTGPHVHYEVRRNGEPIDPIHFLNAGLKLTTYLK